MKSDKFNWKLWVEIFLFLAVLIITVLYYTLPADASEEYRYTIQVLYQYFSFPLLIIICGVFILYPVGKNVRIDKYSFLLITPGIICLIIPVIAPNIYQVHWSIGIIYSVLWIIGLSLLGFFCFKSLLYLNGVGAGIFSILGTLLLCWAGAEIYFLATSQIEDGKYSFANMSEHVLSNEAQAGLSHTIEKRSGVYPGVPEHPSRSIADAIRRYGVRLYDVRYTFDEYGHRIVPLQPKNPKADLLLFGCSLTFGHGLENNQTWPWKLSLDLGDDWLVVDYAMSGFGAQQMLGMLEERELEPVPQAPRREALFLSLRYHLHRFTGIYKNKSIRYKLTESGLERDGYNTDSWLQIIPNLPFVLNGSQSARALSDYLTASYIAKNQEEHLETYAAIIIRSAKLLKEEYNTRLTVLLWPDIEDIAPELEKGNIPVLFARRFLKSWDLPNGESQYQIVPGYEFHPNEKAADELATGLAEYFKELAMTRNRSSGTPGSKEL